MTHTPTDDHDDELEKAAVVPLNEYRELERQYNLNLERLELVETKNAKLARDLYGQQCAVKALQDLWLAVFPPR